MLGGAMSAGKPGQFLVERYVREADRRDPAAVAKLLRRCARELTREGEPVRYVRSIFLPGDETCLDLYVAASADAVSEATTRAGFSYDRIVAYE
jgi:Nickel responsive protein SCO4226-like